MVGDSNGIEGGKRTIKTGLTLSLLLACLMLALLPALLSGCSVFGQEVGDPSSTTSSSSPTTELQTTSTQPITTTTSSVATTERTTTTAASSLPRGTEYTKVPGDEKVVALTFDAAYDPAPLPGILTALFEAGVPGTFFLTGEFAEDFPESVEAIAAAGHRIGNHSYSHPDFTTISDNAVRSQLKKTEALLGKLGVPDTRPLFRPPSGARDSRVLGLLASEGYVSVYWTIDTLDWQTDRTAEQIRSTVLKKLTPGAIVLMHVGGKQTAKILPTLIEDLKARGYGFVSLDGLS